MTRKRKIPKFKTDKEGEEFLDQDLSDLDFSKFKSAHFEFQKKDLNAPDEEARSIMEVTLQVDPDIQAWLNRIIKKYGRTPEYWLMELARVNRENLEDSLEADRALEEMRIKGEKPISSEEIRTKYGIQD